ncbi:MAG: hypothetical protein NTW96_25780 [Planctomycetia bacterium]|nr:hypothetical protein [Planctomycetia bacterium]
MATPETDEDIVSDEDFFTVLAESPFDEKAFDILVEQVEAIRDAYLDGYRTGFGEALEEVKNEYDMESVKRACFH